MTAKLKPCKAENGRHKWEHIGNKTVRCETRRGIELSRKGIYRCPVFLAVKYGEPREQAHVAA